MKNDLFSADGPELKSPEMKDVDTDHSEDSDLLDMIGRDSVDPEVAPESPKSTKRQIESSSPFLLESLYFQSFGERPLLTREEETALAKRIDQGSSTIRATLRHAHRLLSRVKRSDAVLEAQHTLQTVRRLSGLSATALDKVEHTLLGLLKGTAGPKLPATVVKSLKSHLASVRQARQVLEKAKDELVRCNLRLVVDVAKHYTRRGLTLLDLVQEGNIGLMKAAERYQYRKGFKFSTYATWWIRQGITRALADQSRTIRIPVHQTEASHRILRVTRRLGQQLGRPAKLEEIASVLRMRPERLHETVQAFQEPVALGASGRGWRDGVRGVAAGSAGGVPGCTCASHGNDTSTRPHSGEPYTQRADRHSTPFRNRLRSAEHFGTGWTESLGHEGTHPPD